MQQINFDENGIALQSDGQTRQIGWAEVRELIFRTQAGMGLADEQFVELRTKSNETTHIPLATAGAGEFFRFVGELAAEVHEGLEFGDCLDDRYVVVWPSENGEQTLAEVVPRALARWRESEDVSDLQMPSEEEIHELLRLQEESEAKYRKMQWRVMIVGGGVLALLTQLTRCIP